jgi:hypothetical protein
VASYGRVPACLFTRDGDDVYVPTDLTRGPWSPDAQHGGPPAALLVRAAEAVDAPEAMVVTRATFELLRPVPMTPLRAVTTVLRPGRKVQLVGASLFAGDVEVSRAVVLRVRAASIPLPPDVGVDAGRPDVPSDSDAEPADGFPSPLDVSMRYFHRDAMEIRPVAGGFDRPGPATAWFRLRVPIVAGSEPSGAERVAATADFGNGLSWVLPEGWLFINPDLTLHLLRPPVGEWVCLASRTLPSDGGVGMAESAIYDSSGRVGRGVQSLLLDDHR